MKISLNWLSDYVDLHDIEPGDLADKLTLATAETEGVEIVANAAAEAVVAEIVDVTAMPDADGVNRNLATVVTRDATAVTVTSAPNVRTGVKVAYAPPGARLPGGTVAVTSIAGQVSDGMLCSAAELGLGRFHEMVLECPADAPTGAHLSTWIPAQDVLIDFDNKSLTHRPDLWGHYGFAREVAAILRRQLRPMPVADLAAFDDLPPFPAADDAPDDCPYFSCLAVNITANVSAPLRLQARLHLLGQRTFNVLVDVTNYLTLDLGQPTHMYDRRRVSRIRVAPIGAPAKFCTLDGQDRSLEPDDLMIFDGDQPIGLAGIMGGADSGVRPDTTEVLLESATFRAARVRRTSDRLGLRTDASQRFEKGQPPSNATVGLSRLMRLLEDSGGRPAAVSRATALGDPGTVRRIITMPSSYIQDRAGAPFPAGRITQILTDLGFGTTIIDCRLEVEVPPFRSAQDISLPADILEEVLRINGYSAISPHMPTAMLTPVAIPAPVRREHKARRLLAQAHGFTEVENYPWLDDDWNKQLNYEPGETLRLRNPVAPQRSRLRTTLIPGLLRDVAENGPNADEFRLFEIGRVYLPGSVGPDSHSASPATHLEQVRLAGASIWLARAVAVEDHYRDVKGVVEDLGALLASAPLRTTAGHAEAGAPWQVPDLWADILLDPATRGTTGPAAVGATGVLMGPILDTVAPQRQVVWFELALSLLTGPVYPEVNYVPVPSVPGSRQDFSLVWREADGYECLARLLDEFQHPLVQRRDFVTVYRGKSVGTGLASYTFRYWLQADHTLSGEELDSFRTSFLAFAKDRGIELR